MRKITNSIRITKCGKSRIKELLNSPLVHSYHKSIIRAVESRMPKNVSQADAEIIEEISKQYGGKC